MSYIWKSGVNNEGNGTDNNQYYISDTSSLVKRLTIQRGSGSVGINTNTPISITDVIVKLDVNGSINFSGNIYKNGQPYVSNSTSWIENETKTKIYYMSGNVGINNIEPLELLDVNGNIKSTNIIANGSGLTNLNASEIITGKINNDRLPETISVSNFIGSGEYLTNLNGNNLNIDSGKIINNILPSVINVLSFEGDGQGLNNLDASKFTNGNINNSRLPANISVSTLSGSGLGITNLSAANISGNIPNSILPNNIFVTSLSGIGTNITELNASEIKTGKIISSEFLPDNINAQYLSGDGNDLSNLDASKITQGKLNNNLFNNDITITEKLTVNNLSVSGSSAIISSSIYETENLEIINYNSLNPSLTINHNSTFNDLLQIYFNNNKIFTILNNGNVGIGGAEIPNTIYKLDVSGNINSTGTISTNIALIRDSINLYKSSTQNILIKIPQTLLSSYTLTLPNAGPSANNILKSDSIGNLSWVNWVNNNESPTLENVFSFFDDAEFEKTSNIILKNIKSSKLIYTFNNTQFELFGSSQIIRIKDNILISGGNVSISSLNNPSSVTVNTLNINDIVEPVVAFEESVERMYPPTRNLTSSYFTISGQSYGNGNYIISESTIYNNDKNSFSGFNAFNDNGYIYHSRASYGNGGYNGDKYIVPGYNGEWIKIKLPYAIKLTKYGFKIRGGFPGRIPGNYKIYGSNDDINWDVLVNKINTPGISYYSGIFTENIANNNFYNYYAIVANTLNGRDGSDDSLNIDEFYIYGKEDVLSVIKPSPKYNYQYITLTYESAHPNYSSYVVDNQRIHTLTFPEDVVADILVVGGGGAGGKFGGGGGAGAILFKSGAILKGTIIAKVGRGGVGSTSYNENGQNGMYSSITINGAEYISVGGGGGGTRTIIYPYEGRKGNDGGSGGGGSHSDTQTTENSGGISVKNIYFGWESYGNSGGFGKDGYTGNPSHASGGGGGAGGLGGNIKSTGGGDGGSGKEFISYFGINVGHNGWFAGGGGGGTYYNAGTPGYPNGGLGLSGGGGIGGFDGSTEISAGEGLAGTGGGGGGSKWDGGSTEDQDGGDGGSGIVIIRYYVSTDIIYKYFELTHQPNLVYDFTPYNDFPSWTNYATQIGATWDLELWYSTIGVFKGGLGYIQLQLPSNYDTIQINYANPHTGGNTSIYIDTLTNLPTSTYKDRATAYQSRTYTTTYTTGQYLKITEDEGVIGGDLIITFSKTHTKYEITFPVNTKCDILIIGGGGGGGNGASTNWEAGGGGAGGVVYIVNKIISAGTYKVSVGDGGKSNSNGYDSFITNINNNIISLDNIDLIGKGGGKGATTSLLTGSNGGSGGGGGNPRTDGGVSTQGNTFWNGTSYISGGSAGGKPGANSTGGGGGGAGENGDSDGAGYGGDGVMVNITGVNTFYAGGGNAFPNRTTERSSGGGGLVVTSGNGNGGDGIPNSGSGGAGAYGTDGYYGGKGGSGKVIIRYYSNIKTIINTVNFIPKGYLKYDGITWNVEDSSILTSKVLHNELCISRYLSSNNYSMINIYEYSVMNDVGVSGSWITINDQDIIHLAKSGNFYENNIGSILRIRLKSSSLKNVYKCFLVDHYLYTHKINCTIKNITGSILYNSQDLNINNSTFFSNPELFIGGINLLTNNIPTNVKHILELKLSVSYDASSNNIAITKEQTDKFYLFYEHF